MQVESGAYVAGKMCWISGRQADDFCNYEAGSIEAKEFFRGFRETAKMAACTDNYFTKEVESDDSDGCCGV